VCTVSWCTLIFFLRWSPGNSTMFNRLYIHWLPECPFASRQNAPASSSVVIGRCGMCTHILCYRLQNAARDRLVRLWGCYKIWSWRNDDAGGFWSPMRLTMLRCCPQYCDDHVYWHPVIKHLGILFVPFNHIRDCANVSVSVCSLLHYSTWFSIRWILGFWSMDCASYWWRCGPTANSWPARSQLSLWVIH